MLPAFSIFEPKPEALIDFGYAVVATNTTLAIASIEEGIRKDL